MTMTNLAELALSMNKIEHIFWRKSLDAFMTRPWFFGKHSTYSQYFQNISVIQFINLAIIAFFDMRRMSFKSLML